MAKKIELLNRAAKKNSGTKEKKSDMPVLEMPETEELREAFSEFQEAAKEEKTAKAKKEAAQSLIKDPGLAKMQKHCLETGKFYSAVKLKAGDAPILTLVTQNKYSKISSEHAEKLEELFGEENFNKYFEQKTEISLSDKAMKKIEDVLPMIVSAFGGKRMIVVEYLLEQAKEKLETAKGKAKTELEKEIADLESEYTTLEEKAEEEFLEMMTVIQYHEPKEKLHKERLTEASIQALANKAIEQGILKPYSPSLRS